MAIEKKHTIIQFLKFAAVGVLNTLIDLGVFYLLRNFLQFNTVLAHCISFTCGVLNSYLFNSSWTFKKEHKHTFREFASFIAVNLIILALSLGLIYLLEHYVFVKMSFANTLYATFFGKFFESVEKLNSMVCKIVIMPATWLLNFILNKLIVFKSKGGGANLDSEHAGDITDESKRDN